MTTHNGNYTIGAVVGGVAVGIALAFPDVAFAQISGAEARNATLMEFRSRFGTNFDSTGIMYPYGVEWDTLAYALALNGVCGYQLYLGKNVVVTPNMSVDSAGAAAAGYWTRRLDTLAIPNIDTARAFVRRVISWAIDGDTLGVSGFVIQPSLPECAVLNNAPNPFNHATTFTYSIPSGMTAAILDIYNVAEQRIASFVVRAANGRGSAAWNGRMDDGTLAPSGLYLVRMRVLDSEKRRLSLAEQKRQYRAYVTKIMKVK